MEVPLISPLQAGMGASTAMAFGEVLALAGLHWTESVAPLQVASALTPFVVLALALIVTKSRWPAKLIGLAVAVIYAFLGFDSPASFVFLGFVYPSVILAILAGRRALVPVRALLIRLLGLIVLGLLVGVSLWYVPYPSGWVLALAPWLSSRAPTIVLVLNRSLGMILGIALWIAGPFSSASVTGGTAGLFALAAITVTLRGAGAWPRRAGQCET
ncbi:hypothetical protein [Arthrobacter sp. RCC_34]|uniref:hypothetical protein n=1 Tax=Arthrobacter sp. RCC_34 TaxID=3239230 RepID=UPI0035265350